MATNKPSLKEKLYQETLDEISRKTNLPPDKSENWQDVKDKVGVEDYKGFAVFSIYEMEKAVKLTIDKTEVEARSDTAKEIFAKLEKIIVNLPPSTKKPVIKVIFPRGYDYKALKKEYKVD